MTKLIASTSRSSWVKRMGVSVCGPPFLHPSFASLPRTPSVQVLKAQTWQPVGSQLTTNNFVCVFLIVGGCLVLELECMQMSVE